MRQAVGAFVQSTIVQLLIAAAHCDGVSGSFDLCFE
jgi:hypothetical protein